MCAGVVGGASVELIYDSALDESSIPPVDAFAVLVDGASRGITAVTVQGHVVTLVLASSVMSAVDVTVSYAVPTAAGAHRVETTSGEAAVGFSDRPVVVPPEAPTITAVESSGDGLTSGVTASWSPVEDISGYDLEWRRDGEEARLSQRVDAREQFTLMGLVRGALYWVRTRAVKTGGETEQTLYVTDWSAAESGIAGDLIPQNLIVAVGDGMLTVIWDEVPAATGYEVEYWPTERVSERTAAVAVRGEDRWRATIAGLNNGESYGIAVRSVRSVAADSGVSGGLAETVRSPWATSVAMPGTYLGASMSTYRTIGVLYERIRVAAYGVWWSGSCGEDYVLWQRRASDDAWSSVGGLVYAMPADSYGPHYLTEPDLGFRTYNAPSAFRDLLRRAEGRRFQLRCAPASEPPPVSAEDPPGVLVGEVVFHRNSGQSPQAPLNVTATTHLGGEAVRPGELVVTWDGFDDSELTRIRSSVVGYKVQWRWFDGGDEYTDATPFAEIAPFARSYVIGGLAPGRDYEVSVRAESSTDDGTWSPWVAKTAARSSIVDAVLVGGAAVELTFDSDLDESSIPPVDAFSVVADGTSQTISGVTVAGRVVTLTLASPIASVQTITVSYTAPNAPNVARIQTTNGAAAAGFSDEPVTIPPDPPAITGVESTMGGLTVSWAPVGDVSRYDLEWRQEDEQAWQSVRTGLVEEYTIGDLTDGALYWVRIRAVKTHGEPASPTIYTTAWSAAEPGVAGDWAPQNLLVTPGDRSMMVSWDVVAAADGYIVEYRLAPDGLWIAYGQGPETARGRPVAGPPVILPGLDNGTAYDVRVRSVRRVSPLSGGGEVTVRGAWVDESGVPGVPFRVVLDRGPRFVRGAATVSRELRLADASVDSPYASRPVAVDVRSGPSVGAGVRCRVRSLAALSGLDDSLGSCWTDSDGYLTVVYTAATVDQSDRARDDIARIFADANGDSLAQVSEYAVDLDVVTVLKPVDYVALGDSFSSGQQGEGPYSGRYLTDANPADPKCRRWDRSYSQLIPGWRSSDFGSVETFACTGAITLNIHHPGAPDYNLPFTTDRNEKRIDPDATNRPSGAEPDLGAAAEYRPGALVQASDWEPRQGESLRRRQVELGHRVDMVTVTIGGNDVGFADALTQCYLGTEPCGEGSVGSLAHTRARLASVLAELKRLTRGTATDGFDSAAIFVFGYPYLVPLHSRVPCFDLTVFDLGAAFFERVFSAYGEALVAQSRGHAALGEWLLDAGNRSREVMVKFAGESYGATVSFAGGVVAAASAGAARAGRSIVDFGGGIGRGVIAFESAAAQVLGALSDATVEVVIDFGEFTADAAVSFAGGTVRAYRAVGESYRYLSEGLGALGSAIADAPGGAVDVSVRFGADAYDATVSFAGGTVDAATAGAARTVRVIVDFGGIGSPAIVDLGADASRALVGAATGAVEVVVDFGDGALDATLDFGGGVVEAAGDLFDEAIDRLPDAFEVIRLGGTLVGGNSGIRAARSAAEFVFNPGNPAIQALVVLQSVLRLDGRERRFIRRMGEDLNATIRSEAELAGVHFVDVAAASNGREPCNPGGRVPWIHGLRGNRSLDSASFESSGSFHPTETGQEAYADLLLSYIDAEVAGGATLTAAGLPVNPEFARGPRPRSARTAADTAPALSGGATKTASATQTSAASGASLEARREAPAAVSCGAALVPGERVRLVAAGFAAQAAVTFTSVGVTGSGAILPALSIPAATADADGRVSTTFVVPAMPASVGGSALRWYMIKATGSGADDATLEAYTASPLVAYAAAPPCVVADTATTTPGRPVRILLLANDTAPAGGSLDAATLDVAPIDDGSFAVSTADGSVTFTPEPGFAGTVTTHYWVRDNWGIALRGELTITVDAGCTITGTPGVALIEGTDGDDVICVPNSKDRSAFHIISAGAGNDTILAGEGVEWIHAGDGDDTVYGAGGDDEITGGPGVDTIHGGAGLDTIHSTDLADTIIDDTGGYQLLLIPPAPPAHTAPTVGGDAAYAPVGEMIDIAVLDNDFDPNGNLVAASLSITRAPSAGAARVVAVSEANVLIRYTAGTEAGADGFAYEVCDTLGACAAGEVAVTVGTAHCTIVGTEGDDTLSGTASADVICGLGGNDTIYGLGGDDVLLGGPGDDSLYGGDETLIGDDGDDVLFGGTGDDRLFGGAGDDTLRGGPGGDALVGNRGADTIHGGAGNDIAVGGGEDDVMWGGAGDDNFDGHAGDDTAYGGPGRDILGGGYGDDALFGGAGNDQLTGGAGADTLWGGADIDLLWGNTQNDTLHGGAGIDILRGGGGDDRLTGGVGNDQLHGNAGDDRLWGGPGDDSLDGGNGADYSDGGDGADVCSRGETGARCGS